MSADNVVVLRPPGLPPPKPSAIGFPNKTAPNPRLPSGQYNESARLLRDIAVELGVGAVVLTQHGNASNAEGADDRPADILTFRTPAKAAATPKRELARRVRRILRLAADWDVGHLVAAVNPRSAS